MVTTGPRRAAQDRRQQIVDAATELFALQGFRGTTTRQIADTARVNEAIIFRHFGRKEHLYRAVIERECLSSVNKLYVLFVQYYQKLVEAFLISSVVRKAASDIAERNEPVGRLSRVAHSPMKIFMSFSPRGYCCLLL